MTEATVKQTRQTFCDGAYIAAPSASALVLYEHLNHRSKQLSAMLAMVYGAGNESFREHDDETQNEYLWACGSVADECKSLVDAIGGALMRRHNAV